MMIIEKDEFLRNLNPFGVEESQPVRPVIRGSAGSFSNYIRNRRLSDPNFALLVALLTQALKDLGALQHGNRRNHTRRRHWTDAAEWFISLDENIHSFRWVCEHLKIDPDAAVFGMKRQECKSCGKSILLEFCLCRWRKHARTTHPD